MIVPRKLRQFSQENLVSVFTTDQTLDVIFYSFFNLERSLNESFKLKVQHLKFLDQLYEKELLKKKENNIEARRLLARTGREAFMFGFGASESGYNLGEFIQSVKEYMQKSREISEFIEIMGIDKKSKLL